MNAYASQFQEEFQLIMMICGGQKPQRLVHGAGPLHESMGSGHRAVDSLPTLGKSLSSSHKPRVSNHTSFQNNVSVRKHHCCLAAEKHIHKQQASAKSLSITGASFPVPLVDGHLPGFCLLTHPPTLALSNLGANRQQSQTVLSLTS